MIPLSVCLAAALNDEPTAGAARRVKRHSPALDAASAGGRSRRGATRIRLLEVDADHAEVGARLSDDVRVGPRTRVALGDLLEARVGVILD